MRGGVALIGAVAIIASAGVSASPPETFLIWNRTESAPQGLYVVTSGALETGAWAAVSSDAPSSKWIAENGYLGRGWPLIKRVAGAPGDEICRDGDQIFINAMPAARALKIDGAGREFPRWQGCFTLRRHEVFLLNNHPRSLDGRYFGATKRADIIGVARLIVRVD